VGFVQGIVAGIGYFMFGVPNAIILTIVTIMVSILPVIGPSLIWVPTVIYLFIKGNNVAGIELLIYGLFLINWIQALLTPRIMSRTAEMNPAIALIGIIGGLYAFGILGLILGPLILAYFILLIEIYRDKKSESILIKPVPEQRSPISLK
jgi:predicted PurR-regulated permease PerM